MFRALLNDVKSAAGSLVARYVARASVAVPFLVAFGFATAAVTLMLVERYGAIAAYWMIAGGFTAIGVVAAAVVSVKEQDEAVADAEAEKTDTRSTAESAIAQAATQAPLAILGALLSTPFAPNAVAGGAKLALRNMPLVVLLVALGFLLWPAGSTGEANEMGEEAVDNGAQPSSMEPMPNGLHREAA